MLGEFSVDDGIKKAKDMGLDLVEISPNTNPPICKILDLGKYKYQQQKKQNKTFQKYVDNIKNDTYIKIINE